MKTKDTRIIKCSACGAKNRISTDKINAKPKCGKCGAFLATEEESLSGAVTLRCTGCWTRNKVPLDKIDDPAKCGKCGLGLNTQGLLTRSSVTVTDADFEENVLKSPLPVLLFAWAPWCPTCRTFIPIVDSFAADSQGKARVAKINVDDNPGTSSKYEIMSVPRIFIFDRGELKKELPGSLQKHEMMMKMMAYLL